MKVNIPEHIKAIVPYPPGKPVDELEREYGIRQAIKLASNENSWGPSPRALEAIHEELKGLHRYPDGAAYNLTQALAQHLGCDAANIVLGNGSNEVIEFLVKASIRHGDGVITSHPSFLMYQKFVQIRGGDNVVIPLNEMRHDFSAILQAVTEKTRLIFLDNPNNPTGTAFTRAEFLDFCRQLPESVIVVLDEAYVYFVDPQQQIDAIELILQNRGPALVSLRTFSKAYGLAGLRVGFGVMSAELASVLHRVRQPFNINTLGQVGALAALLDDEHYRRTIDGTHAGLRYLSQEVAKLGCKPYPSQANFFLIDVRGDADPLYEAMLHKGLIVRSMTPYGLKSFIRVTVGTEAENERFLIALRESVGSLGYV